MGILELLKKGLRKNLGNGDNICLLRDSWLPRPMTFKTVTPSCENDNRRVKEFITSTGQWNLRKLSYHLYQEDVDLIVNIPISGTAPDRWVWHYDKFEKYTVRSGYKVYMQGQTSESTLESDRAKKW